MDPCADYDSLDECKGSQELTQSLSLTLSKLSTFVFSFTCHQNIFSVCNEIKNRTQGNIDKVIFTSIVSALSLYLIVAWSGYCTFGDSVESDVLNNYPQNGLVTTMRIFVAFLVIFSYPLQLDPSRRCITTLVSKLRSKSDAGGPYSPVMNSDDGEGDVREAGNKEMTSRIDKISGEGSEAKATSRTSDNIIYYAITLTFLSCSFALAMIVDDLGIVLALVGATGSTMVSYILPATIYLKVFEAEGMTMLRVMATAQLIAGCFITPVALYFILS